MATIVVRNDRLPVNRERQNLTAIAHQRLMMILLVILAIYMGWITPHGVGG